MCGCPIVRCLFVCKHTCKPGFSASRRVIVRSWLASLLHNVISDPRICQKTFAHVLCHLVAQEARIFCMAISRCNDVYTEDVHALAPFTLALRMLSKPCSKLYVMFRQSYCGFVVCLITNIVFFLNAFFPLRIFS